MSRGRHQAHSELARDGVDSGAQFDQFGPGIGDGIAHASDDFDLAAQKFMNDPVAKLALAAVHETGGRIGGEGAGFCVDEVVFLLDAEGQFVRQGAQGCLSMARRSAEKQRLSSA